MAKGWKDLTKPAYEVTGTKEENRARREKASRVFNRMMKKMPAKSTADELFEESMKAYNDMMDEKIQLRQAFKEKKLKSWTLIKKAMQVGHIAAVQ